MHHIQYITFISTTDSLTVDQNVRYHMHKYNITDIMTGIEIIM